MTIELATKAPPKVRTIEEILRLVMSDGEYISRQARTMKPADVFELRERMLRWWIEEARAAMREPTGS